MSNLSGLVDRVLTLGIPAYVDLQQAKNFQVNDPTPGMQNPDGSTSAQGLPAFGSTLQSVPQWVWIAGAAAAVFLVVSLARRR